MPQKIEKIRLDIFLVNQGFFASRARAQAEIMAGCVYVNGKKAEKAGMLVASDAKIEIRGEKNPYVSRGGLKLEKALEEFKIETAGLICLDIGASTGGFTDCLLQKGARRVYAIDVGRGQLAWKLRNDPRVVVLEKTNARYLTLAELKKTEEKTSKKFKDAFELPQLAVMDVSFISILKIFPVFNEITTPDAKIISLIKPQFEAGKNQVEKGGLVKNPSVHEEVLKKIKEETFRLGFTLEKITYSPIKGADGNIEYFGLWSKNSVSGKIVSDRKIKSVVEKANVGQPFRVAKM